MAFLLSQSTQLLEEPQFYFPHQCRSRGVGDITLPDPPQTGTLDIRQVLSSPDLFA